MRQRIQKRFFDIALASVAFVSTSWIMAIGYLGASLSTRANGVFTQKRVGRHGRIFRIYKLRTMRNDPSTITSVTTSSDPRITKFGRFLRASKIDELPQLVNVLKGDMSFVGPRPDVPGFADKLEGKDRVILELRPGITGPATIKYRDEERFLSTQPDPESFNRDVLFVEKIRLNLGYASEYSFGKDIVYLLRTVTPVRFARLTAILDSFTSPSAQTRRN